MRARIVRHLLAAAAMAASAATFSGGAAATVPQTLTHQGRLFDANGAPLNATISVRFSVYDAAAGGNQLWTETYTLTLDEGYYSVQLGSVTPFGAGLFDGSTRYFGVTVGNDAEMSPRTPLVSVPYALVAGDAIGDIHPTTVTVNGQLVIDDNGHWVGSPTGLVGPQGPLGPQGATGPAGTNGPTGPTGAMGPAGTNGAVGATGVTGPQGVAGATGATGSAGTNGTNGAVGATGPTGPQGVAGATGATGSAGTNGTNGATGATGATGTNGTNGLTGPTGATGPQGVAGNNGAAGSNGSNGGNGATGPQGPTGATGFLSAGSAAGDTPYWNGSSWIVSSANLYNNGTSVGIATASPTNTLSVNGNADCSELITTGANAINAANPYVADVLVGSDRGVRHNSSIMMWSATSASRIYQVADVFHFQVWDTLTDGAFIGATVGSSSYFSGPVGINTVSPGYPLDVETSIGGVSGHFSAAVQATSFNVVSDAREKRVLDHVEPEGALRALSGVDVVKYEYLYRGGLPRWGVLAQQLGEHVPDAVLIGPGDIDGVHVDDFHTVDFSQITALELAAIQGLDARTAAAATPMPEVVAFEGAVESGDLVCDSPSHPGRAARCESPDAAVLGVVIGGGPVDGNPQAVASAGRAGVKVGLENGPIRAGDLLAASSSPGVAMRADGHARVVGVALEAFGGGDGRATVLCFVKTGEARMVALAEEASALRASNAASEARSRELEGEVRAMKARLDRLEEALAAGSYCKSPDRR